jgi:hypothetical protein
MKQHLQATKDSDEFDFSATYGTAVRLLESDEVSPELCRLLAVPRIGHLPEQWAYLLARHPRAA